MKKFIPKSPDPFIKKEADQELAKFGHINAIVANLPAAPAYKQYMAIMSQTGTNAPTVDQILVNTIGDIVWEYLIAGEYNGRLADAFLEAKVPSVQGGVAGYPDIRYIVQRNTDSEIDLQTPAGNGTLTKSLVNIIVAI